jgi:hypothetical protein
MSHCTKVGFLLYPLASFKRDLSQCTGALGLPLLVALGVRTEHCGDGTWLSFTGAWLAPLPSQMDDHLFQISEGPN